jgi:anti-anti-sigma factor
MRGRLILAVGRRTQKKAVLRLEGSIDPTTYKQFESTFRWLNKQGILVIAVDMAKLTYISSAGLSLLVKAQTERLKRKGGVVLVRPQTPILNILKILGLTEVFRIASSVEEGLHSIPLQD